MIACVCVCVCVCACVSACVRVCVQEIKRHVCESVCVCRMFQYSRHSSRFCTGVVVFSTSYRFTALCAEYTQRRNTYIHTYMCVRYIGSLIDHSPSTRTGHRLVHQLLPQRTASFISCPSSHFIRPGALPRY